MGSVSDGAWNSLIHAYSFKNHSSIPVRLSICSTELKVEWAVEEVVTLCLVGRKVKREFFQNKAMGKIYPSQTNNNCLHVLMETNDSKCRVRFLMKLKY